MSVSKYADCPICLINDHVRIAGKRNGKHQYLCKLCHTYFFIDTYESDGKKDRIKYKRYRLLNSLLSIHGDLSPLQTLEDKQLEYERKQKLPDQRN